MALRFATREKGKRKLIDNGHVYIRDKSNGEKHFGRANILEAKSVMADFIRLKILLRKGLETTIILAMHVERKFWMSCITLLTERSPHRMDHRTLLQML